MIKFSCPHCNQHLEAEDEMAGTSLPCPACEQDIRVPPANAIRIASSPPPKKRKWNFRLNGSQLKLLWIGIGLLAFFGIFQMHLDDSFTFYNKSAQRFGIWYSGYGSSPGGYGKPQPFLDAPDIEFTPIFDELIDNTVAVLFWITFTASAFMILSSDSVRRRLSKAQRVIATTGLALLSVVFALPVSTGRSSVLFTPVISEDYDFTDYTAYFAVCCLVILAVGSAAFFTAGMQRRNKEDAEPEN